MAARTLPTDDQAAPGGLAGDREEAPAPASRPDPYVLTVEFEVSGDDVEPFLALVRDNAARSVEAEPGCLRFDVLVPEVPRSPRTVLLYEIYVDRAAFESHLASEHYRRFDAETGTMVARKTVVRLRLYEHAKGSA